MKKILLILQLVLVFVVFTACGSENSKTEQYLDSILELDESEIIDVSENPSDVYEKAINSISSGDTIKAIELFSTIPSYKDAETYLIGYSCLEYFIGKWEISIDDGFDKGTTVFPYEMSFDITDKGIWLDESVNGFQRLRFPVSVTYTIRNYNKTEEGTDNYEGYLFFYLDREQVNTTVAFGLDKGGIWYNLVKNEDNLIKGSFSVSDKTGEVDSSATNHFYCKRITERQECNITWDKSIAVSAYEAGDHNSINDYYYSSVNNQALEKAKSYLGLMAFSRSGLIEQLEYEGYSHSEATTAVDHCGVDWEEQALKKALSYLDYSAFSYSGLIEQLEYEGFTSSEAQYGAKKCGADWNAQAVKKAKEYLSYSSFSRSELIDQLVFEGFTQTQAEYGASKVK